MLIVMWSMLLPSPELGLLGLNKPEAFGGGTHRTAVRVMLGSRGVKFPEGSEVVYWPERETPRASIPQGRNRSHK